MAFAKRKQFIRKREEEKPVMKAAVKKVVKKKVSAPPPKVEEEAVVIPAPEPEVVESEANVEEEPKEAASSDSAEASETSNESAQEKVEPEESHKTSDKEQQPEPAEEKPVSENPVIEPLPPIEEKEKKRGFFWQFFLFVFIGFAIGSGFFLSQELLMKGIPAMKKALPTTVIEEVHVPTQPVEEKTDTKTYTISVLNGSGKSGEAAKAKTVLDGEKYTVENVGNADTSDYTQTLIQAKKAVSKDYLGVLKKALEDNDYVVSEPETLAESEDTDIVIIVGNKRKESE